MARQRMMTIKVPTTPHKVEVDPLRTLLTDRRSRVAMGFDGIKQILL